jgi:ABC-type Fe3+/spermidine/putrescine transport system ATPase subunit
MLFEHMTYALFPHLSIYENLIYGQRVRGVASEESEKTADEMLRLLMLADRAKDFPRVMSGGMKQRVALGRALMTGAELILLDEPLGALDAKIRLNLRKELVSMVKALGYLTVIHVTQDIEEALMVSDYIVAIFSGKILQIGTPEEIYNHPNSIEVCSFFSTSNFFEGSISGIEEPNALIDLHGITIQIKNRAFSKGDQVVVAIRATDLSIQKEKTSDLNQLQGKVLRYQFNQGVMRYEIELENKNVIVVNQRYDENISFKENEKVTITLYPTNIIVFPHPGESLEEKIIK